MCTICCQEHPFEIQVATGGWLRLTASLSGSNVVINVSQAQGQPIAVRYAWQDIPQCGLYDAFGTVSPPFNRSLL